MHRVRFWLGLASDPAGSAYSAPPDPIAGFSIALSSEIVFFLVLLLCVVRHSDFAFCVCCLMCVCHIWINITYILLREGGAGKGTGKRLEVEAVDIARLSLARPSAYS